MMFSGYSKWISNPARRLGVFFFVTVYFFVCEPIFAAAKLTVQTNIVGSTPKILGYNSGHFYPGSNTREWWRYAGVNGVRVFINPTSIEPTAGTISGGVTSLTSYTNRLATVRANPTSGTYIGWSFTNNYATELSGNNNIVPNYACAAWQQLGVQILACITCSSNTFTLNGTNDWADMWPIWRHYYAQAFYLGRTFNVQRYQMYNEPNYGSPPAIAETNYLLRLQIVSDAIQSAIADVNRLYNKSLTPLVLAPVTSGSAGGSYSDFGALAVTNRHLNQFQVVDPNFSVLQKYDYHQYNGSPSGFGSSLASLHTLLTNAMTPEAALPTSISEFNIYDNATYSNKTTTLDSPTDYAQFGDIAASLMLNTMDEMYCFKFSETINSDGSLAKNGMLYVENNASPYNIGGITKAGEVWRLFNKGFGAGQSLFGVANAPGLSSYQLSYDPVANSYYIFAVNNSASTLNWAADLTAWKIPTNNLVLIEEVSESCYGAVAFTTNVSPACLVGGLQPAYSVWLLTIPAGAQNPPQSLIATDDAMVEAGGHTGINYGSATNVLVQNNPTHSSYISAGLLKFHLPTGFNPTNLQVAMLSLHAASVIAGTNGQAHVYGLASTNWTQSTVKWTNAPNLLQGISVGTNLTGNFVVGVGDWTNSATAPNSAQLLGQVVADANYNERLVDVTDFIKSATNADVSFLLAREVRFDGDLAYYTNGISIVSTEADTNNAPQLKFVFNYLPPAISGIINHSNRTFALTVSGVTSQPISLQATTNLTSTNWLTLLATNLPTATWNYTDTLSTNFAARYYRTVKP